MSLIASGYSLPQALPSRAGTESHSVQSVESVRAALRPWLRAIGMILRQTNDDDVRSYVQALRNSALMVPSGEGGPAALAQRILAPPPDTNHPWIGVIVIDSHKDLPAGRWQQLASTSDFAAEYHDDTNTIYLRSDIPQVAIMRGLLLVHEMRHWWQARHPGAVSESRLRKEVDAYETEFRVLDALKLPRYGELLSAERLRIKNGPIQPDLNNPLLERVFGRFPGSVSRQIAATEMVIRAAFAELDSAPAERAAGQDRTAPQFGLSITDPSRCDYACLPKPRRSADNPRKMTNPSPMAKDVRRRLQDAEQELASIKEQLKGPTTPEVRRALAERLNRLQEEIQLLRGKLPTSRKSG